MPAAVITVSDRSAAGARDDVSGPVAVRVLREAGFACADARVVADGADSVEAALRRRSPPAPASSSRPAAPAWRGATGPPRARLA